MTNDHFNKTKIALVMDNDGQFASPTPSPYHSGRGETRTHMVARGHVPAGNGGGAARPRENLDGMAGGGHYSLKFSRPLQQLLGFLDGSVRIDPSSGG